MHHTHLPHLPICVLCLSLFLNLQSHLRISTLCGAGNEIGAATGAVLALGLTFFKVRIFDAYECVAAAAIMIVQLYILRPHLLSFFTLSLRLFAACQSMLPNVLLVIRTLSSCCTHFRHKVPEIQPTISVIF